MAIPSWINPPNYLAAMSSGANLGLNVRQQGFNERMSIEQLRQDQVRQALAVQQLRAAEARAQQADRLRALQFEAEQQQAEQLGKRYQDDLALRIRGQDFREQQALLPQRMTPYQEASLGLREQEISRKTPPKSDERAAEEWLLKNRISQLQSEISKAPGSLKNPLKAELDETIKKFRRLSMPPELATREERADVLKQQFAQLPDEQKRASLPQFQTALSAIESGSPALLPTTLSQSPANPLPAGEALMANTVSAPMTNQPQAVKPRFVFDVKTGKWLQ